MTALPVSSFVDAYPHLRRPFVPDAVRFKLQHVGGDDQRSFGLVIAYIDARNVTARLNTVCPGLWQETYEQADGGLICHLTIDGITHTDWGITDAPVAEMRVKGTYSDALKRAAVRFGVGESLYATPALQVYEGPHLKTWAGQGGKRKGRLQPAGEVHCRNIYAEWLERSGVQAFGEPLDHGDGQKLTDAQVLAGLIEQQGLTEEQTGQIRAWAKNGNGLDPVKVIKAIKLIEADETGVLLERVAG